MNSLDVGDKTDVLIDFVLIGAMKSGTTHLYLLLSEHPGINMSSVKEPNFFCYDSPQDGNWALSAEWYSSLFQDRSGLRGEASPNYTKHSFDPRIAQRLFRANPKAKLIYLLRDPTDRAVSHYLHNLISGKEVRAINIVLQRRWSHYLRTSRYHEQLQPYLNVFPKEQILLLPSELLAAQPKEALTIIYDFLGLPILFPSLIPEEAHTLSSRLTRRNRKFLAKRELIGAQKDLCNLLVTLPHDFPWDSAAMAEKLGFTIQYREKLISLLAQDTRELAKYLKESSSLWPHWTSINWLRI